MDSYFRKNIPDLHILVAFLPKSHVFKFPKCLTVVQLYNRKSKCLVGEFKEEGECCEAQTRAMVSGRFWLGLKTPRHSVCILSCSHAMYNDELGLEVHYDKDHL